MAAPVSDAELSRDDDVEQLRLAESYHRMSESAAWKDLVEKMEAVVSDAQEAHFKSRATDPMQVLEGKLQWQQRMLFKQSILYFVQGQLNTRLTILEEMKGIDEHTNDNAE